MSLSSKFADQTKSQADVLAKVDQFSTDLNKKIQALEVKVNSLPPPIPACDCASKLQALYTDLEQVHLQIATSLTDVANRVQNLEVKPNTPIPSQPQPPRTFGLKKV